MCQINETHPQKTDGSPDLEKWHRKALSINQKLLVISDHNATICGTRLFDACIANYCIAKNLRPFVGELPEEIHVVAHTRKAYRNAMELFADQEASGKKLIILHVSSVGPIATASEMKMNNGLTSIWLSAKDMGAYTTNSDEWLRQFLSLTFDQARKLLPPGCEERGSVPADIEQDRSEFLDILFPGRIENRLAFRLLCEAYKFKKIDKSPDCEGIVIHAPEAIDQWLDPFGKKPGPDSAATAKAIDEVAGMSGSGTIKDKAKAVLEVVNGNGGKLDESIDDFLKVVAKPNP